MGSDKSREHDALTNELIQGMEVARKLKEDLSLPSSVDSRDSLLQRILSSYDKALLLLRWNASISNSHTLHQPLSPLSVQTSPHQHNLKKRKTMPKWTEQVRVKIENGVEGPFEDGYSWRKYGQKDILSAKYPRSYYRCRFRHTKGCCATKQVQRSEEEPTIFDITYRGSHTCKGNNAVVSPKSRDIQEKPHGYDSNVQFDQHVQPSQESLTKYANTLNVETDNITFGSMTQHNHTLLSSLVLENDPFFNRPESNYFVSPSFVVHEFDGVCNKDSDVAGIVSAHTSTTNSTIFDFNFSLDEVGIDSNFPFNASGFLS